MDDVLADILETCLERMQAGASVEECLASYPAQRDELEAPLRAAALLRVQPQPALPAAARAALETQMLARAAARRAAASNGTHPLPRPTRPSGGRLAGILRLFGFGGSPARPWLRLAGAVLAVVLALVVGAGVFAAARAVVEALAPPPTARPTAVPTATLQPAETFMLDGPIEQLGQGRWVVKGITVALDERTALAGTPTLGVVAHIQGVIQADGTRLARSIALDLPAPTTLSIPIVPTRAVQPQDATAVPSLIPSDTVVPSPPAQDDVAVPAQDDPVVPAPPASSPRPAVAPPTLTTAPPVATVRATSVPPPTAQPALEQPKPTKQKEPKPTKEPRPEEPKPPRPEEPKPPKPEEPKPPPEEPKPPKPEEPKPPKPEEPKPPKPKPPKG